jgi:DNA-binding transcriptional MerR regulator
MTPTDTVEDVLYLSPNQSKALNALLQTPTVGEAAALCGLSPATLKRYLAEEHFASAYRKQRMLILQQTVSNLTHLSSEAVGKLEAAMSAGDVNTELRAACRVLDYVVKLVELERRIRDQDEIEQRLQALEAATEANDNGYG